MALDLKIFLTLFLAVFSTTMGVGLVAPLLPVFAHELGAGSLEIGLIFGAFSLTRTLFVPYFGRQSDLKGRKNYLSFGMFLYFFISLLFVFTRQVWVLILLRLAQGFASAMILPVAQAYVGRITPLRSEGWVMGLFNVSLFGGLSLGPLVGGVVNDWLDIRFAFLSMGLLSFIGFALCLLLLPKETPRSAPEPGNPTGIIPYLELVKVKSLLSLVVFRASFTTCIGIIWAFLPLLASSEFGLSSSAIGFMIMSNVFVSGLFQVPMGYLADRVSKRVMVVCGGILAALAVLGLTGASSFLDLMILNVLLGLAGGISFPSLMAIGVIEGRKMNAMGSVMGLLALAHSLGMLIGPLLAGGILAFSSFPAIFVAGALILGAGTLLFWRNQDHDR
jgi:MFS transporter, DHA1 family, multidrug resistance protein